MNNDILANLYSAAGAKGSIIPDPGDGGTIVLNGKSGGVCEVSSGTRYMPEGAPLGVTLFVLSTGSVTLVDGNDNSVATFGGGPSGFISDGAGGWNPLEGQPVINALRFGAVADNATDATAAINRASEAAEEVSGILFIPRGGTAYLISGDGVEIGVNTTLVMEDMATFRYSGTGKCLSIVGSNANNPRQSRVHRIGRLHNSVASGLVAPPWNAGTDTSSVGLFIDGCYGDEIHFRSIVGFFDGILMPSVTDNTCCNTIHVGRMVNNKTGIHIKETSSSYGTNQNTFLGGQIRVDSAWTTATARNIWIERTGVESNGNTFIGTNLEKGGNAVGIQCAGDYNTFINCRFEGASAGYIIFDSGALYNKLLSPVAGPTKFWDGIVTDSGTSTWIDGNDRVGTKGIQTDLNGHAIYFSNGTVEPANYIAAFGTNRIQIGGTGFLGLRYTGIIHQEDVVVTSGATPTINGNMARLNYASPTTITTINSTGALTGVMATLRLFAENGNVTLGHNSGGTGNIRTTSGSDTALSANSWTELNAIDGVWYEK